MIQVSKEKAEFYSGDGYSGMDYPMTDADINIAVIKINGEVLKQVIKLILLVKNYFTLCLVMAFQKLKVRMR